MSIGIITCHDVYNFGSSLQAYSLCRYLTDHFKEVEIIDYKPNYLYRLIDLLEVDAPRWKKNFITRSCYRFYMLPKELKWLKKYIRFKEFNKIYLPLSKDKYKNNEDLKKAKYDIYICGSDQIWNSSKSPCGEDPAFYLSFASGKKISYAASIGSLTISNKGLYNLKTYLPNFDNISVRERSSEKLINDLGFKVETVIDPVFLTDASIWKSLKKRIKNLPTNYILAYGYDNSDEYTHALKYVHKVLNIEIIDINSKIFRQAGPREFITLIENADMVVTTSFHALAFSIILHTPFVVAKTGNEDLYERIRNLLEISNLKCREFSKIKNNDKLLLKSIDYDAVDERMKGIIKNSKTFLLNAL